MKSSLFILAITMVSFSVWSQTKVFKVNTLDGLDLEVQEWGNPKGKEIVFIHGLGQSHLSWMKQTGSELLKDFRIITYDLRGHGNSDKPNVAAIYSDGKRWGEDLDTVIRDSKLKKPIIVGWSLGGYVINNYLSIYGDNKISGIIYVDAITKFKPEYFTKDNFKYVAPLSAEDLKTRSLGIKNFLAACFKTEPNPEDFELMLILNAMVPTVVYKGLNDMSPVSSDKVLSAIHVPTLVITGKEDKLITTAMGKYTQGQVKKSTLSVYENSGHAPFYEEHERVNQEVKDFISKIKL